MVIVEADGEHVGLLVDELMAQQQIVVKSLETNYGRIEGLAGATILGDGGVAFILDAAGIGRLVRAPAPREGARAA
jgi:two-component system chemotaxis sensor kinase CheA